MNKLKKKKIPIWNPYKTNTLQFIVEKLFFISYDKELKSVNFRRSSARGTEESHWGECPTERRFIYDFIEIVSRVYSPYATMY